MARLRFILACFAGVMLAGGCAPTLSRQGRTSVPVVFQRPQLSADLERDVMPRDVRAAARVALRRAGYTILKDEATATKCTVTARAPGDWRVEKTVIKAWDTGRETRVLVKALPFGDEPASRALLDDMLAELGR